MLSSFSELAALRAQVWVVYTIGIGRKLLDARKRQAAFAGSKG